MKKIVIYMLLILLLVACTSEKETKIDINMEEKNNEEKSVSDQGNQEYVYIDKIRFSASFVSEYQADSRKELALLQVQFLNRVNDDSELINTLYSLDNSVGFIDIKSLGIDDSMGDYKISSDGEKVIYYDGNNTLMSLDEKKVLNELKNQSVYYSESAYEFAYVKDGSIIVKDIEGRLLGKVEPNNEVVHSRILFDSDQSCIAFLSNSEVDNDKKKYLEIWDYVDGNKKYIVELEERMSINLSQWHSTQGIFYDTIYIDESKEVLSTYNIKTNSNYSQQFIGDFENAKLSPTGRYLMFDDSYEENVVKIFDRETNEIHKIKDCFYKDILLEPSITSFVQLEDEKSLKDFSYRSIGSWILSTTLRVDSSSNLVEEISGDTVEYSQYNVLSDEKRLVWSEGVTGEGIGEWIKLSFYDFAKSEHNSSMISGIVIKNGFDDTEESYLSNNRIKEIKISFSDGTEFIEALSDIRDEYQIISFPNPIVTEYIQLTIMDVYKGTKYDDTCISELRIIE